MDLSFRMCSFILFQNYLDIYKTFIPSNPQPTDLKKKRKPRGPKPVINEEFTRITRSRSRYEAFLKSQPPTSTEAIIVPISPVKPKENEKSVKMIRRKSIRIQNAASEMCQNQKKYIRALSEIQSVKVVNDDDEWEIKPCENINRLIPMPIKIMRRRSTANTIILNQTFNDDTEQNSTVVNKRRMSTHKKATKLKSSKNKKQKEIYPKMPKLTRIPKPFPPIPVPSPPIPLPSLPKLVPIPTIPPYNPEVEDISSDEYDLDVNNNNNDANSLENIEDLISLENTEDGLKPYCATCLTCLQTSEDMAGITCDTCSSWHHLQCVKLDSQVGKNQCYQRIVNIGFARMPKGTVYKCFINCAFQSYDKDIFRKHVVFDHDFDCKLKLIDSCGICQKEIILETLEEEFDHMIDGHINGSANTVTSSSQQTSLPTITIDCDDKLKEIFIIDLAQDSQGSDITVPFPDFLYNNDAFKNQNIQDQLKNKSIEEQLQILDDNRNFEGNKKVINDNENDEIAVPLIEKTIEEQLQILDSVQDSSTKVTIPINNCAICGKADRFDMIKCNDCDSWIHNTCKQDTDSGKKCQHLKHFDFSTVIEKPKELSTDDLLEMLSPGIENGINMETMDTKDVKEAALEKHEKSSHTEPVNKTKPDKYSKESTKKVTKSTRAKHDKEPTTSTYETRGHNKKYKRTYSKKDHKKTEPTKSKYESRSYSNNYETRSYSNKQDKEKFTNKSDKEQSIDKYEAEVNPDKCESTLMIHDTESIPIQPDTEPTPDEHDVETKPKNESNILPIQSQAYSTENILPNVEEKNPIETNEVKSIKKQETEVEPPANENEVDLNMKYKLDLNSKQPEPNWDEAIPTHEVFKLIKKDPPITKFFKFSAMQPWVQSRPNVKSKNACASMTSKHGLISTYKCLGRMCSYYTSSAVFFHCHLRHHSRSKKDSLYDFFLFCSYCSFEGNTVDSLIDHIQELHCANQYQCPFCFYRCLEAQSCSEHVKNYHNEKPLIFYECPVKGVGYDVNKLNMRLVENRESFVLPVSCSVCVKPFYTFKKYTVHMSNHAYEKPTNEAKQNKVCLDMAKLHELIENKEFGLYQCLFCLYGSDIEDDMRAHLANKHPSEFSYVCKREADSLLKAESPQSIKSTQLIKLINKKIVVEKFQGDPKELENKDNWCKFNDKFDMMKSAPSTNYTPTPTNSNFVINQNSGIVITSVYSISAETHLSSL
ncbi:unnamed protein product [Diamesa hyperborea]